MKSVKSGRLTIVVQAGARPIARDRALAGLSNNFKSDISSKIITSNILQEYKRFK